jgi:hypothetical protein
MNVVCEGCGAQPMVWHYCPDPHRVCLSCLDIILSHPIMARQKQETALAPIDTTIVNKMETDRLEAKQLYGSLPDEFLSQEQADTWGRVVPKLTASIQADTKAMEEITKPQWKAYKAARAHFTPTIEAKQALKDAITQRAGAFELRKNAAKQQAMTTAAQQQTQQHVQPLLALPTGVAGLQIKGKRSFRVVDERIVPDKYCGL